MVAPMRSDFSANREAFHTYIKVGALGTLDTYLLRYVLVTVIAMVERLLAPTLASSTAHSGKGV
jgi:hypothetical protein